MLTSETPSKLGSELSASDRAYVLTAYIHRYTKDHKPAWALWPWKDGKPYPVQFASDADWLANTRFGVTPTGKIDTRLKYCESSPTWPDNPELRDPRISTSAE